MVKLQTFGEWILLEDEAKRNALKFTHTEARQLIADIMAALDEPAKVDVTTQAYQEFAKRPSQNAVDDLWAEKETPFTTEQKMQAVIRKAEEQLMDIEPNEIGDAPFKEVIVAIVPRGFEEWYAHYQYAVRGGYIRR